MSVLLQNLYHDTAQIYGLKLIAGNSGLKAAVQWIYIAESLSGPGYLNGGELILTTGVLCRENPDWLYHFIEGMIRENACGLILNVGKYITPAHITDEIISLCNTSGFPLFTMPWETAITALTHDYYARLVTDSQYQEKIDRTILDLIHQRQDKSQLLSELEEYGYPTYQSYGILYIHLDHQPFNSLSPFGQSHGLRSSIEHCLRNIALNGHLCSTDSYCILLLSQQEIPRLYEAAKAICRHLDRQYPALRFTIGIGSRAATLANLPRAFFHARSSALIALSQKKQLLSFEDLGIYQLLLSVTDRGVLSDYVRHHLQPLQAYDRENDCNCTEIFHQYLLYSGSIQHVAEHMFCHRNTINNRMRIVRDILSCDISDANTCFEFLLAFCIQDFLQIPL